MTYTISRRAMLMQTAALGGVASLGAFGIQAARAQAAPIQLVVGELDGAQVYNGRILGPTIRAMPGDVIDVDLINDLPPLHDDCTANPNDGHGANTTNLHTHGLHVSPYKDSSGEIDADNIFVSLVPEGQIVACDEVCGADVESHFRYGRNAYRFELPDDHASGTFWYHAHKHGSTADQVSDGLAGPLIIDDVPGVMPAYIEEAVEKVLFITDDNVILADPEGGGEIDPVINMRPGEVQRWRIINGTGDGENYVLLRPSIDNLEMFLIAFDGLTLTERLPMDHENLNEPWFNPAALASGNRMDVIVRAPLDAPSVRSGSFIADLFRGEEDTRLLDIEIDVSGDPVDATWSDDASLPGPGLMAFGNETLPEREINFTPQQTIDRQSFDGDVEQTMQLGTAEDWTVGNRTGALHVYHIHVNPFFVTHINGEELPEGSPLRRWQDTIGVPLNGSIRFKTRFETFPGKFVIHCHVLPHEDNGMMQIVEVVA